MQQKLFQNRQQKTTAENSIMKMSLTLMDLTELIYYKDNKYIKSYLDRKLYANKSQRKMVFNAQMDEQQTKQTEKWNRSIFKTIFPLYENKTYQFPGSLDNYNDIEDNYGQNSEYQNQNYPSHKNKFIPNPYSSTKLTQKKQDPNNFNIKSQKNESVPTTEKKNYQPPQQYTLTRPTDPIQDPAQEDVVLNKRTTGRSAPPRRRQK